MQARLVPLLESGIEVLIYVRTYPHAQIWPQVID